MPKRTVFDDEGDTFTLTESGALEVSSGYGSGETVVSPGALRDFHAWLGEEIARLDAEVEE